MPGPGEEREAERRIESTERGGDKEGGEMARKGDGNEEGAEKNKRGSEVEDGAGWKGTTGKDDVCCKCVVMAERGGLRRRRRINWHFKWENEVRRGVMLHYTVVGAMLEHKMADL